MRIRNLADLYLTAPFIRKILAPLIRAWFRTCKVVILNEQVYRDYVLSSRPVVACTWHRAAIYLLYYFGRFQPMVMMSRSKDGEILAHYAEACGIIPVRGSSSSGSREALQQMCRHLQQGGKACATVLDGPRGPAFVAKKGMLVLAKLSGAPLMPVICSASRSLTIKGSWDSSVLPLPWSRIYLAVDEPIHVPPDCDRKEMERLRQLLQSRLNSMMFQVDRCSGYHG
ncbi:MAG: lysophospholipid acyltransferase family protein [Deltaproteobacteria bacterium]|nr:lysophospholipid acyltransferase family protein [Deltaproteobacteria bacterium]MBW2071159.1 lysophospholipid acyltransferase family protein [Deltaproteobacteria bacterium]